jgi:hypothetical protein
MPRGRTHVFASPRGTTRGVSTMTRTSAPTRDGVDEGFCGLVRSDPDPEFADAALRALTGPDPSPPRPGGLQPVDVPPRRVVDVCGRR